ncbi:hypothetical protein A4A49_09630 [Nicotiana attenuata]|uniref:Uncharacterized protein n=1 Tax=Nicotiana attenuata TaxID=49451 RepID=A0A1J6J7B2_NICAT|nr:hypothetical protein A4A49_09630 [Nicotiana attenuata]
MQQVVEGTGLSAANENVNNSMVVGQGSDAIKAQHTAADSSVVTVPVAAALARVSQDLRVAKGRAVDGDFRATAVHEERQELEGVNALDSVTDTGAKAVLEQAKNFPKTSADQANAGHASDVQIKLAHRQVTDALNSGAQGVQQSKGGDFTVVNQSNMSPNKKNSRGRTKSNNWTMVNKSPSKKQSPGVQNQIVPSNIIGVSNSFDALVNECEHVTKEAENKEQQMDDDTRSVAGKPALQVVKSSR